MTKYIVCIGNLIDGHTFHGPFDDELDAVQFGEHSDDDFWIAPLHPDTEEPA